MASDASAIAVPGATRNWLLVRVGDEAFGLPVPQVQEILHLVGISRVSDAPFCVRGAVNLRGSSVPVVDLRLRMELGKSSVLDSRLVVVRSRGRRIGLLVDSVERLATVMPEAIEPLPETAQGTSAKYLSGVLHDRSGSDDGEGDDRLVLLLDLEKTLRLGVED